MKFSSVGRLLPLICLVMISLMAFAPLKVVATQDSPPVVLPDWAVLLIQAGIGWLITQGLKSLSKNLPGAPNLEGKATAITGGIVTAIVVFANSLLALIPPEVRPAVVASFGLAAAILSAYGIAGTVKGFQPPKPA